MSQNSNSNQIFYLEQNLLQNLNNFNIIYANYIRCTNPSILNSNNKLNLSNCPIVPVTESDVQSAHDVVLNYIQNLENAMMKISMTENSYENNLSNINSTYQQNVQLRAKLDQQLRDLYDTKDNSYYNMYKTNMDSTMYAGITWVVLASFLVFYIMRK